MLRRKIKDGARTSAIEDQINKIDKNQNIIDDLTKAITQSQENISDDTGENLPVNIQKEEKKIHKKTKANTKFGQVKIRHARRGVSSCLVAMMGVFVLCGLITSAYQSYGDAPGAVGGLAILTTVFCTVGFMNGIHGFRERDKNYITCKLGILFNGAIIFMFFLLYMRGVS